MMMKYKIWWLVAVLNLVGPTLAAAAGPVYWDWPADRAFAKLEFSGAALNENGQLVAGLTMRPLGPTGPEIYWRVVADGEGGFYTGTGHGGEVYHTDAKGKSRLLATLAATEIFSLLPLPSGDLLVGCGPEGHLYRVQTSGASEKVGTVSGGYIWNMILDEDQKTVWLATGSPAGLAQFELSSDELETVMEFPAQNALDLHLAPSGGVLIATQGPGLVYHHQGGDQAELVFETAQDEARQFITGPENGLYLLALESGVSELTGLNGGQGEPVSAPPSLMPLLATNSASSVPAAALYRLSGSGAVSLFWTGGFDVMTAAWSPRWGWLAAGEMVEESGQSVLRKLTAPYGGHELARWDGGDVLDILVPDDEADDLVIAQAHPGAVVGLGVHKKTARYATSQVLDGGGLVKWGRLNWRGGHEQGQPQWSVRTGNRKEPDDSWSDWSKSWTEADHALDVAQSRYLQWRVDLPQGKLGQPAWRLSEVSLSAWQENVAPVISAFQLEYLKDISLGGMLRGTENVTQRFRSGLQAEFSLTATADYWAGPERGAMSRAIRIFTWVGNDANGDRIGYKLEYRRMGSEGWRSVSARRPGMLETSESLVSWDTVEVQDGKYEMRLTASDRWDNPGALAMASERILSPILVDNTPPEISRFTVERTEAGFQVSCRAEDVTTALAGARLILPDGSAERLDPVDHICDSLHEDFAVEVQWPRPGREAGEEPWQVRVELRDLGGNVSVATDVVR